MSKATVWKKWIVVAALATLVTRPADAATTSAVIFGDVIDVANGNKAVPDAIIVVTSPSLQGEQTAISDENGSYRIDQLPPGDYEVKASAPGFKEFALPGVKLLVGREIKVRISMIPELIQGEEIVVSRITSSIDQGSTTTGLTVTKDYMERVTTKRSMEAITEATPGAQIDEYGISFAGSTSPENNFVVDGLNVTNTQYGVNGVNLPIEFFDQIAVSVGGYMPEFGNATGGVVNAITKLGGNEFHGSVFNYTTPLRLQAIEITRAAETISRTGGLDIRQQIGFELGGPIVKDRLWFHVGFAPTWSNFSTTKRFRRQVDRTGGADGGPDGIPDRNAQDQIETEEMTRYALKYGTFSQVYSYTAKLTLNINDGNRITVGTTGNPSFDAGYNNGFGPTGGGASMTADESHFLARNRSGDYNVRANYEGKFLDNKLLLNAVVGYTVSDSYDSTFDSRGDAQQIVWTPFLDIAQFEPNLAEDCKPFIDPATNQPRVNPDSGLVESRCRVANYQIGGVGYLESNKNERVLGNANVAYILKALGTLQLKGGIEIQHARVTNRSRYTGGTSVQVIDNVGDGNPADFVYQDARRYGRIRRGPDGQPITDDPTTIGEEDVEEHPFWQNSVYFNNYAAFAQAQWAIEKINVNLAGGLRFDFQDMYGGIINPQTRQAERAFALANLSPRVGAIWDPLGNGRTKIMASYGRFYQLVPLNALIRSLPAEETVTVDRQGPGAAGCTETVPTKCPADDSTRSAAGGVATTQIAQDISGQYTDQVQVGAEYQILQDLMVGVTYQHNQFGNVIEDVALDDTGSAYFLGNPGVAPSPSCKVDADKNQFCNIQDQVNADPLLRRNVTIRLPKPERRYDGISIYVTKSLSRNFIIQASYVLSFLRGNFSGLFRPETQQINPNITSDFDLATLLPNRYGYLPSDRRHQFKLDGAYIAQITERFSVVPNLVFRVESGQPYSYTGAHRIYGTGEAYILTRGVAGTTDPYLQIDVGVKAEYKFSKDTALNVGLTFINVGSIQLVRDVDQDFTQESSRMRPVLGGDKEDLKYLKDTNNTPVLLNPNFGVATRRWVPMEMRVDARLTF
ncbi:MAG: TonB-dependent receptor [Deltaproteobacteria bacterium]|nr:TonB-dependent receptor [Deltaproteobacteria bacterium]